MFKTSAGSPAYVPANWTTITGNSAGALTFTAIPNAPISGAAKILWGIIPGDVTITKNYLYKPPSWNPSDPSYDGVIRSSKDFVESKYGQRWNISANAMVNSWNNGQAMAFNFNSNDQNGDCPWCVSSDISLTNNVVKNIAGEFAVIASQDYSGDCPGSLARVLIQNNLFWVPGGSPYIAGGGSNFEFAGNSGSCGVGGGGVDSLQIIHNHLLGTGINMQLAGGLPYNFTNLLIRDNLTEFDQYRWTNQCITNPDGAVCINSTLSASGTYTASNNAIINSGAINGDQGQADTVLRARYGTMILSTLIDTTRGMNYSGVGFVNYTAVNADYHNFALAPGSPFHGRASDGTDPGVNFAQLDAGFAATSGTNATGKVSVTGKAKVN
jgi:hypothetical protein